MIIAALFTIAQIQKEALYPSTDEWIKKKGGIHIQYYIIHLKKQEIQPFVAIGINLRALL